MSDEIFLFIVLVVFLGICFGCFTFGQESVKVKAFERGYMIECVGKTGYYWSCDE